MNFKNEGDYEPVKNEFTEKTLALSLTNEDNMLFINVNQPICDGRYGIIFWYRGKNESNY